MPDHPGHSSSRDLVLIDHGGRLLLGGGIKIELSMREYPWGLIYTWDLSLNTRLLCCVLMHRFDHCLFDSNVRGFSLRKQILANGEEDSRLTQQLDC